MKKFGLMKGAIKQLTSVDDRRLIVKEARYNVIHHPEEYESIAHSTMKHGSDSDIDTLSSESDHLEKVMRHFKNVGLRTLKSSVNNRVSMHYRNYATEPNKTPQGFELSSSS